MAGSWELLEFLESRILNQCWQTYKRRYLKISKREDIDVNGAAKSVVTQLQDNNPSCHTQ